MRPREALNAQNVTQIGSQGTPRAKVRVAVFEGFGRRDDPRLIWSQFEASQVFSKKKSQFFGGRHAVAGVPRAYPSAPGPIWDPLGK